MIACSSFSKSEPKSWIDNGRSLGENSTNLVMSLALALTVWMEINSVTTKPAPSSRQINRRAGSLTPAMGAKNALLENLGSLRISICNISGF